MNVFQHIADFIQDHTGFTHIALKSAFSQIPAESFMNLVFIFYNSGIKPAQTGNPHIHRKGGSGLKIFSLSGYDIINFLFGHFNLSFPDPLYPHHFPRYPSAGNRKAPALRHS